MKLPFLITGLLLLIVASLLMMYTSGARAEGFTSASGKKTTEAFASYFLEEAGGYGKGYEPIGTFIS